jgi:hypothetical protein
MIDMDKNMLITKINISQFCFVTFSLLEERRWLRDIIYVRHSENTMIFRIIRIEF